MATTVRPMTSSEMPREVAISTAPPTRSWAPMTSSTSPASTSPMSTTRFVGFSACRLSAYSSTTSGFCSLRPERTERPVYSSSRLNMTTPSSSPRLPSLARNQNSSETPIIRGTSVRTMRCSTSNGVMTAPMPRISSTL